ncbi:unnamed protein product, partial [Sphacelaria rigidula]
RARSTRSNPPLTPVHIQTSVVLILFANSKTPAPHIILLSTATSCCWLNLLVSHCTSILRGVQNHNAISPQNRARIINSWMLQPFSSLHWIQVIRYFARRLEHTQAVCIRGPPLFVSR